MIADSHSLPCLVPTAIWKKEMRKIQMLVHNDDDSADNHLDVMKTYSAHWFELKLNPSFDSCIVWIQTETKVYLNRSILEEFCDLAQHQLILGPYNQE